MALTTAGANKVADASSGVFNRIGLFNNSGSLVTSELTATWGSASGGVITLSNAPIQFSIPSGATVSKIVVINDTGGALTTIEEFDIVDESYPNGGFFTVNSGTYTFS